MPHQRIRFAVPLLHKLAAFWPIIGVIGLRQVGKSTLLKTQVTTLKSERSLDDLTHLEAAESSPQAFLGRLDEPALIDEIQKAPRLFDALKLLVDRKRKPGRFFVTGSIEFSLQAGVRESLTGRIGLLHLLPMTLGEAHGLEFDPKKKAPLHRCKLRLGIEDFSKSLPRGGLPVPLFARDPSQREMYFQSWLETSVFRDARRAFGKTFDPEFAFGVLQEIAKHHEEGSMPTLSHFSFSARKGSRYLQALQAIFLVQKIASHEKGVGRDAYVISDTGLANHLMKNRESEGSVRSLTRIRILNEIRALHHYTGELFLPKYYKSQKGEPVDIIWDNTPILIHASHRISGWDLRAIDGAKKALRAKNAIVAAPLSEPELEKGGVSRVPWTYWS